MYLELVGAEVAREDQSSPGSDGRREELSYSVECWSEDRKQVEKVLARAANITLD